MLRIGEFSKLSQLTVKALRFYEREGVLAPSEVNPHTGYKLYTTSQLTDAAKVKQLRQLGFSVGEVKQILAGDSALRSGSLDTASRNSLLIVMTPHLPSIFEWPLLGYRSALLAASECHWGRDTGRKCSGREMTRRPITGMHRGAGHSCASHSVTHTTALE